MSNWLFKRLTPAKAKEARWADLAQVLASIWEEFFDPDLSRLERLRSSYTADDADLVKKIRSMGDYFSFEMPRKEDRPVALAWRRLEIEYKDMELILRSVFRRHFGDLPVTWLPLFAPVNEVYGTRFLAAEGPWADNKNVPPEGWFLTSRGLLGTDFGRLLATGLNKADYLKQAMPLLLRTKPLHIVLDGVLWYIRFETPFEHIFKCLWERENYGYELQFSVLGSRFDFTPADATFLDVQKSLCTWDRESFFDAVEAFPDPYPYWHLDSHLPEGFPPYWLPLDTFIAGNESRNANPCALVAIVREETPIINAPMVNGKIATEVLSYADVNLEARFVNTFIANKFYELAAFPKTGPIWHLDFYLPPGFPETWLPVDTIIAGNEADAANPCALAAIVREGIHDFRPNIKTYCNTERSIWAGADFDAQADRYAQIERPYPFPFETCQGCLDTYPLFDEIPADFAPLDMPVGGFAHA